VDTFRSGDTVPYQRSRWGRFALLAVYGSSNAEGLLGNPLRRAQATERASWKRG